MDGCRAAGLPGAENIHVLSPGAAVLQRRREQVEPVFQRLRSWLENRRPQVPPSTLLGKAVGYAVAQWPKLIRYLDSAWLKPDNNAAALTPSSLSH